MKANIHFLSKIAKASDPILQPLHKTKQWIKTRLAREHQREEGTAVFPDVRSSTGCAPSSDALHNYVESEAAPSKGTQEEPVAQPGDAHDNIAAHDDAAFTTIFSSKVEDDFILGPSQVVHGGHKDNELLAIYPNAKLASGLHISVLAHRKVKAAEAATSAELAVLVPRYQTLQTDIADLQLRIDGCKKRSDIIALPGDMTKLLQEKDVVWARQDKLRGELRDLYESLRENTLELFDLVETLLVVDSVEQKTIQHGSASPPRIETSYSQPSETGSVIHTKVAEYAKRDAPTYEDKKLLYSFDMWQRNLRDAEYQINSRVNRFDDDIARVRRLPVEERTETWSQVEVRHFRETQRMTRRAIEVEIEYEKAKAALLAAGIQPPGSDIESGFVDDVDDGYRASFEQDEIASVDPECVQRWLDGIPDPNSDVEEEVDAPELHEWTSEEVEVWESRSMLAEGSYRRRIDKWRDELSSRET